MPYLGISFGDLPHKATLKIFQGLTQTERLKNRRVCKLWNRILLQEFPVELSITNDNYEQLFLCPIAQKVSINSLTEEFTGEVAFATVIRSLEVTGKVLSSNLLKLLQGCQNLEILVFSSLKQVLEIESSEVIRLPKVATLEIKVRPDQETFTSDEMIIINTLRQIQFGSLESILITVHNTMFWDDDDEDDLDSNSQGFELNESNELFSINEQPTIVFRVPNYPSLVSQANPDIINPNGPISPQIQRNHNTSAVLTTSLLNDANPADTPMFLEDSNLDVSIASDIPLLVDQSVGMESSISDSMNSMPSLNESEFVGRLFSARLQMQLRNSNADLDSFLNDPSRPELHSNMNRQHNTNRLTWRSSVFFEFIRNNSQNLKNFIVKTRPDFMCFGNISSFSNEVSKIQFEEVEYSFGRSQLRLEFVLLQVQSKLRRIRVHILDDLWDHLMAALDKSQESVIEVDLKILSLSEDPIDLVTLSRCKSLKILKLLHFFEKQSLNSLPNSLTKIVLNGPIKVEDLLSFTVRLVNLVEFTLILNNNGGKVDTNLFKRFVKMPKIAKLIFIQCLMDVNGISDYCDDTPGLILDIQGPRELMNIPSIQYVMVSINTDFHQQVDDLQ